MVAFEAGYAFWDTVTAAYLARPHFFTTKDQPLNVITTGPKQGETFVDTAGGYAVTVAQTVEVDAFYQYLVEQWKMPLPGLTV